MPAIKTLSFSEMLYLGMTINYLFIKFILSFKIIDFLFKYGHANGKNI